MPDAAVLWLTLLTGAGAADAICTANLLCVSVDRSQTVALTLRNKTHKPLSFRLFLTGAPQVAQPVLRLQGPEQRMLTEFDLPRAPWGFEYRVHYGHTRREHDDTAIYWLPYPTDQTYLLSQSHTNISTHRLGNRFALDWTMPVGTPVHAAREGTVVSVYEGASRNSRSGSATANHIWVRHADGTIGKYLHLAHGGAAVAEGDEVDAGQQIGLSGNTGFTHGPHLHFSVSTLGGAALYETFNVRFSTSTGVRTLEGGVSYRHPAAAPAPAR